jgi:hypothetical protein
MQCSDGCIRIFRTYQSVIDHLHCDQLVLEFPTVNSMQNIPSELLSRILQHTLLGVLVNGRKKWALKPMLVCKAWTVRQSTVFMSLC